MAVTYPPQQPPYQPQQPPYPPQQPPYPQQQQPYPPQQPGWGQQQPGYPMGGPMGPPMGGGLPPRPPSKRPLILSVAGLVVVALVVVFVGGFAWPGWFTGGGSSSSHQLTQNDARAAAQKFVNAINNQDATTLGSLACPEAQTSVQNTITKVTQYHVKATLGDLSDFSSDLGSISDFVAKADVTVQGQTESYTSYWSTTGYQFCVSSIMDDGASGGS